MGFLTWIVFGGIVGLIANMIDSRPAQGGAFGAIILGIVGAMVGGFLSSLVLGYGITGFNFTSALIAVLGSLVVLFLGRSLTRA